MDNTSDKEYWHRYMPTYNEVFNKLENCKNILEFGVFKGASIKWLNEIYPKANIYGADILSVQKEWPKSDNISYLYVDQGSKSSINNLFKTIDKKLDLIIEDGSHIPQHQKNCLVEGLKNLRTGGIYVLEDLHTSHPEHPLYLKGGKNYIGPLHLLLCIEHLIYNNLEMDTETLSQLATKSLFGVNEIMDLYNRIDKITIYRRSGLPHKCYSCGSPNYDYHGLKCKCGVDIFSNSDSITAIIKVI